jgi:hypothetical protein
MATVRKLEVIFGKLKEGGLVRVEITRMYPEVSGLAAWSENCKWYSSLPLGVVVSLFCESF